VQFGLTPRQYHVTAAAQVFGFSEFRKPDRSMAMEEKLYRQSRLCRLLGNPVAYSIVAALVERAEMTPTQLAKAVGRSLGRVSNLLAALRLAEVVRYESSGGSYEVPAQACL
jgi:DNA-binding transcriptional ArsR family regulator